jgi:serine/threonine protein kinase
MVQEKQLINNRFLIVKRLSQGGFGETFEIDDNGTRKLLKILHHVSDPEKQQKAITLFQREADVLMQLNHPGIPHVEPDGYFTFSEGNITRYGLVMEKIEGKTLQEWLQENSEQLISQELALDWLKQLISILEYLHKNNYFHRDIKPSNIMLKSDGTLVLIDFGSVKELTGSYLAKLVEDGEATKLYTPGYAPKEQIEGKPLPQSDFFALGCTFVYLLTGTSPGNLPRDDWTDTLIWRDLVPNLCEKLGDLIDDFMAIFPTQRPNNTHEIWQRITEIESFIFVSQKYEKVRRIPSLILNQNLIEISKNYCRVGILPAFNLIFRRGLINMVKIGVIGVVLGGVIAFPAVPEIANDQGYEYHVKKQLNMAEIYYKLALLFRPNYGRPNYNLGVLAEERGQINLAREFYQKSIAVSQFGKAYYKLGNLEFKEGNYSLAFDLFMKGLKETGDNLVRYNIQISLARLLMVQGEYVQARKRLEAAIALKSNFPQLKDPAGVSVDCLLTELRKAEPPEGAKLEMKKCQNVLP